MEHSDEYDHDNRDNNENSGSEEANYVSDDSVIEDFDDTANNYSRPEASFNPQDVTVMSQDVTHAIELDPSFLPYGTNINKLLARDPVHEQIMRLVEKCATQAIIPFYAKVNFVKLAAINKAKENKIQDVEFTAMMEVVDLAQRGKERRNAENEYERIVLDCTDQVRWLQSKTNENLKRKVAVVFKTILKSIGCEIFAAIDARTVDDLSCILVAATSDWYYRTAPDRMQDSDMTDQATITMSFATSSSLNRNIKPPKAPSAPVKRICVNIITHLSLLGGKPANSNRFYTHDRAGFDEFMDRLLKARLQSRSRYPERLGFLTDQQMKLGKWLYQIATSMETLDSERTAWRVVDESSYKTLSFGENEQIFLIHVSLTIPYSSSPLYSLASSCRVKRHSTITRSSRFH
jgi:hypothetical protein